MAEAFSDVILKLSLQIENQRIERLDTSAAEKSLKEFGDRAEAAATATARRIQGIFDGVRVGGAGGGAAPGGGRGPSAGFGVNLPPAGLAPARRGPNDNLGLSPIGGGELIGRRGGGVDRHARSNAEADSFFKQLGLDQADNAKAKIQQTRGEIERTTVAQETNTRANVAALASQQRLGQGLSKLGTVVAGVAIGYRVLTQVNGEHVNVLGKYEGALESSAIGLSLVSKGTGAVVGGFAKLGIGITASGAALAALPITVAVAGFYLLAKATAENNRQLEINAALDARIMAGNAARRERDLASAKFYVDQRIGLAKRLNEAESGRLERDAATGNRKAGLTTDPAQREKEFKAEELKLFEQIEQKKHDAQEARINAAKAAQRGDKQGESGALERARQLEQQRAALTQQQTQAIEGQRAAAAELSETRRRDLETITRINEQEEQAKDRNARGSQLDQARREANGDIAGLSKTQIREREEATKRLKEGGVDTGQLGTAGGADQLLKDEEAKAKARADQFASYLKAQADSENIVETALEESVARQDATKSALEALFKKEADIQTALLKAIETYQKKLDELGASVGRKVGAMGAAKL